MDFYVSNLSAYFKLMILFSLSYIGVELKYMTILVTEIIM